MQKFMVLGIISLILSFIMLTFGCATSKSHQSVNIGLKAEAVTEGICLSFDNIPPEATQLFISFQEWGKEKITSPHDIILTYTDIRGQYIGTGKEFRQSYSSFCKSRAKLLYFGSISKRR